MNQDANNKQSLPAEVVQAINQEGSTSQSEMARVWELLGTSSFSQNTPTASSDVYQSEKEIMLARMRRQIENGRPGATVLRAPAADRKASRPSPLRLVYQSRILALAATFTLLLAAGYLYWNIPVTVEALPGETAMVTLPDGSQIELNSGTELTYKRNFGALPFSTPNTRQVTLDGEAFFDVAEIGTPFTVETFNTRVGVLGTTFNVRARGVDLNATEVTLASGRVEVSSRMHTETRTLLTTPGDFVRISGEAPAPAAPIQGDIESLLIWRSEGFSANSAPLGVVFAELERRFDVQISVANNAIEEDSISIIMPRPGTVETILDDICTYKDLNYRKTSRGYEIY